MIKIFTPIRFSLPSMLLLTLVGCAAPDGGNSYRLESTLTTGQANRLLRSEITRDAGRDYAVRQLRREAGGGDTRAQRILANSYRSGANGIELDAVNAAKYYEMLHVGGDEAALRPLLRLYLDPDSAAHRPSRALILLEAKAASGDAAAALDMVALLQESGQTARAAAVLSPFASRPAEGGSEAADAQRALADILIAPDTQPYDPAQALSLYEGLAAVQDADAIFALGRAYYRGVGSQITADPERAVGYFITASRLGNPRATLQYAMAQLNGRGAVQNQEQAFSMIEGLAREGNIASWVQLSVRAPERYLLLLQETLRAQGAYSGPLNGKADAPTLAAISLWCTSADAQCTQNPYERSLAVALARSLR